jgi:hypothetical protein
MQASHELRRGVQPQVLLAALLVAALISGAAGYLIRGGIPERHAAVVVATDTVPSWALAGTGPTDADAAPLTGDGISHEQGPDAIDRNGGPANEGAGDDPDNYPGGATGGVSPL